MSQFETLMARDGHTFHAYLAAPPGTARGAVVVVQEIFGVTAFVRATVDSYAADGYVAIAPALFDRLKRDVELGYSPAEIEQARGYMLQVDLAKALLDLAAAAAVVRHAGRTAVVGFCWGGLISWLAACQQPLSAAVSYYGTRIGQHLTQTPQCPMMLHFGEQDAAVPPDEVERIRAAYPQGIFHLYATGHAFANSDRPSYNAAMAKLARSRTDAFLRAHIG